MPRYYCDYCDNYLTHDSPAVRKQHNKGFKHKANVRAYYLQFEQQETEDILEQKIAANMALMQSMGGPGFPSHQLPPAGLVRPGMGPPGGMPPAGMPPAGLPPAGLVRPPPAGLMRPPPMGGLAPPPMMPGQGMPRPLPGPPRPGMPQY